MARGSGKDQAAVDPRKRGQARSDSASDTDGSIDTKPFSEAGYGPEETDALITLYGFSDVADVQRHGYEPGIVLQQVEAERVDYYLDGYTAHLVSVAEEQDGETADNLEQLLDSKASSFETMTWGDQPSYLSEDALMTAWDKMESQLRDEIAEARQGTPFLTRRRYWRVRDN